MSEKLGKGKAGKSRFGYRDGKLYYFERKSVLVLAPWPKPQAWFKNSRMGWHSSRKRADKIFTPLLFAKGDEDANLPNCNEPSLQIWTGDPSAPGPEEREEYVRRYDTEWICPEMVLKLRKEILKKRAEREYLREAIRYVHRMQAKYFDVIPDEVRTELLRYRDRRWHLLCLFARCPGALDLSRSNPALCYALASNWVFHKPAVKRPLRAARSLIDRKQRRILDWLGFPATDSTRRLLQKIDPKAVNVIRLLHLRALVANDHEVVRWLSHLPQIDSRMMEIVTTGPLRPLLTGSLLREIDVQPTGRDYKPPELTMLWDVNQLTLRLPDVPARGQFATLRQLEAFHNELAEMDRGWWDSRQDKNEPRAPFPLPPFAGTLDIQPLDSPEILYQEGIEMKHCAGIYADRVRAQRCFIYKVLAPVRATMEIVYSPASGKWLPGQLRQACNSKVPGPLAERLFGELFSSGPYVPTAEPRTNIFVAGAEDASGEVIGVGIEGQLHLFG